MRLASLLRSKSASGLSYLGLACFEESGELTYVLDLGTVEVMVALLRLSLRFALTNGFESVELPPTRAVALAMFDRSFFEQGGFF